MRLTEYCNIGASDLLQCLIFIDDLAIAEKDAFDAQPPLELYRQWADHKYWSDLKDTSKVELIDLVSNTEQGDYYLDEKLLKADI